MTIMRRYTMGMCVVFAGAAAAGAVEESVMGQALPPEVVGRSVVSLGDTARLERALAKARRGEEVVVAVIGGSITGGAVATTVETRWGNRVAQWWRDTFPAAQIRLVNAGIGATGSDIGAHRAQAHLLDHRPDFVVIEYAVNDSIIPHPGETLEGLVRQVLKQPQQPAAMQLFTMNNQGQNVQAAHETVGRHYGLPMVSYRDALWPEIEAGRLAWDDVGGDEVHPNDRGHQYCADFVTAVLEGVLAALPPDADLRAVPPLPPPCISDVFEYATILNADSVTPTVNEGWTVDRDPAFGSLFGPPWRADKAGSRLEFEIEGTALSVLFYRVKGPMGIAEMQVDDGPAVTADAWFNADWGGYTPCQLVARDLPRGRHTVRIRILERKNEGSDGHEFRVHALLCAGRDGGEGKASPAP